MDVKTLAVVPMKLNKRRLPQKNTKPFTNGKSLCRYILSTLLTIHEIDDVYVLTHATAPFISADNIVKGLNAVKSGEYDSSFSAKKLQDFLWKDEEPFNYALNSIPRTHDLPPMYEETCGFYIYKCEIMNDISIKGGVAA